MAFEMYVGARGDEIARSIDELSNDHSEMVGAAWEAIFSGNVAGFLAALTTVGAIGLAVRYGRGLGKAAKD